MVGDRAKHLLVSAALVMATLALGACSTSIADMPVAGTSATDAAATDAAAQPKEPDGYLPVHDLPPDRGEPVMTLEERAKVQAELIKARDHQAVVTTAAAKDTASNGK